MVAILAGLGFVLWLFGLRCGLPVWILGFKGATLSDCLLRGGCGMGLGLREVSSLFTILGCWVWLICL